MNSSFNREMHSIGVGREAMFQSVGTSARGQRYSTYLNKKNHSPNQQSLKSLHLSKKSSSKNTLPEIVLRGPINNRQQVGNSLQMRARNYKPSIMNSTNQKSKPIQRSSNQSQEEERLQMSRFGEQNNRRWRQQQYKKSRSRSKLSRNSSSMNRTKFIRPAMLQRQWIPGGHPNSIGRNKLASIIKYR